MSGNYGDIIIGDYNQQIVNSSFVTVEAAPGQTPVFSTLYIRSTDKWVFKGVKVQSTFGPLLQCVRECFRPVDALDDLVLQTPLIFVGEVFISSFEKPDFLEYLLNSVL